MKNTQTYKSLPFLPGQAWRTGAVAAAIVATGALSTMAQLIKPFTPGDILVERFGDGSATLTSAGQPIFFDELTPSGTVVQSIPITTNGATSLVDSGTASSDGAMTLSPSGNSIVFPGYNANSGTAGITGAASSTVARGIGSLNPSGVYSLVTTTPIGYSANNIRGATTDGNNNFWASGTGTASGIYYLGLASATNDVYSANLRCVGVYNGNLWYSTGSGTPGIGLWEFPGLPTTATGNTATKIFTTTSSPYNFSVSPDGNTIFYTDDATGIHKLTQSGGTFSEAYVLNTAPCFGLMVNWSTAPATVYATTGSGVSSNFVIQVSDTGAGATAVTNATAGQNRIFRGLNFAPTNSSFVLTAPTLTGINPAAQKVNVGNPATITLAGYTGYPVASNQWYKISGGTTNLVASQTSGTFTIASAGFGDTASYFAILTNSSGSVTSSIVTVTVTAAPVITSVTPSLISTNPGTTAVFTAQVSPGVPVASNFWYKISGGATNLLASQTSTNLTLSNVQPSDSANYFIVLTNTSGSVTSSVVTLNVTNFPPAITSITPTSLTINAGLTATFNVTNTGTPPLSYFWYAETATTTNLIASQTNATLSLPGVLATSAPSYQVVITNVSGSVTSSVVSLIVTNDPHIASQPGNTYGLLGQSVQFSVSVIGSGLSYQWYFADASGDLLAPISDGNITAGGAVISGSATATLTLSGLTPNDLTNFVVVAHNGLGTVTSQVASLLGVNATASTLAMWDFNGPEFSNTVVNPTSEVNPVPYLGVGSAGPVGSTLLPGTSPFAGSADANDGAGFDMIIPGVDHLPNFSWGTDNYPASGSNKQNGVQFNVSTLGAKNITVSYQSRVSATASDYERLQYTTNGTDWIDYPSSSSFNGVGTTYEPFVYSFLGFPDVANNPDFGVRVVTEYQSTATYGVGTTNNYVGTANTYGTSGTVTYDLVYFQGDAISNAYSPPVVSGLVDTNMIDTNYTFTVPFTAVDASTPSDALGYHAVSLNPTKINPTFTFGGSGPNRTLTISFLNNLVPDLVDAAPILVNVTNAAGDVGSTWFYLTVQPLNLAPTNSLTALAATNVIANGTVKIPFTVSDDRTGPGGLTYEVSSDNNTVVPTGNVVIGNQGTANPTLTITPAANQIGVSIVTVTVNDNDSQEPRSTIANIAVTVRPNTNIVAADYFNYDSTGSLDQLGFWQHLSGNFGQMKVNTPGVVSVDTANNTENLVTPLIGAPYKTNSGAVLYSSYIINLSSTFMPINNGSYFSAFQDGTVGPNATADVEDLVVVATNGIDTPGDYRIGIANKVGATALTAQMLPMDLVPGVNYTVVTALTVSNGFSTLWVNPSSQSSPSITDTTALVATNRYSISDFELRESGSAEGIIGLSFLKVGTTFDSVLPSLHVTQSGTNVIVNWSDPTLGIQSTPDLINVPFSDVIGAQPPYTNNAGSSATFYRFGQ